MSKGREEYREEYRGERLARATQRVRYGKEITQRDAELLLSEIDRLVAENIRLREENARLREAAARYVEREMRAWGDGDEIRRERDYWRRDAESKEKHQETLARENKRLERELDMTRAARNVALDKLVQIARVVSPDDFEEEEKGA